MVTAESVKAKLQGLIATANATTGNADADLTAAVNALVAGFGQSGGIPGVDVIKGEYIPGQTIVADAVKLVHGLGAIKPLIFHMKARGNHFENGKSSQITEAVAMVSFVSNRAYTYGADAKAVTQEPKAQVCWWNLTPANRGSYDGGVDIYDSETSNQDDYSVKMWPDGFTIGLYRNLLAGVTYDYTLIYGDLFGGAE